MTARRCLIRPALQSTALLLAVITTGLVACSKPASNDIATKERYNATVRWTAHGVPHIKADDWGSLGYGFAYAVATDAVCTLAREFVNVRGEQSKFFGPEDGRLEADIFHKSVITEQALSHAAARIPAEMTAMQEGYIAGYNRYLTDHHRRAIACQLSQPTLGTSHRQLRHGADGHRRRHSLWRRPLARGHRQRELRRPRMKKSRSCRRPLRNDVTMFGSNAVALRQEGDGEWQRLDARQPALSVVGLEPVSHGSSDVAR